MPDTPQPTGEIVLYQTEDGRTRIECRLADENIWLTQALMAELLQTSVPNINLHIKNILAEGELAEPSTIKEYLIVRREGDRRVERPVKHYSLDMIVAVGYRVKSPRGTLFRQWATAHLKEYIIKGFVLDDERLKNPPGPGKEASGKSITPPGLPPSLFNRADFVTGDCITAPGTG
jgi:hypothetical protein